MVRIEFYDSIRSSRKNEVGTLENREKIVVKKDASSVKSFVKVMDSIRRWRAMIHESKAK